MVLSQSEAERIAAYVTLKSFMPDRADCIFIMGTRYPQPVRIAAKLYTQGVSQLIVLTGGANRYTGDNEAETHYAILLAAGIPDQNVVVENRSTNTLENARFA
jgi:uncharacterized SAM-binding protein YcdF (DUF218 family)